ncbi:hypothetical protein BpHYR1_001142 [Brachionus plicatilis]|uniref:Uncharacterized protein n=1 Tax=Brachionus plicatilis TaxID=10195 RepID=A0A3M7Q798_BRAPC|nr:hypothetical protein BpHYR1_001142 [Brachionus plicatilis]
MNYKKRISETTVVFDSNKMILKESIKDLNQLNFDHLIMIMNFKLPFNCPHIAEHEIMPFIGQIERKNNFFPKQLLDMSCQIKKFTVEK